MITTEIIADSLSPQGHRLTTFILEFPRFILPELNTHRVFSKNAASSRAIPIEKMIKQVIDNPAMPVWWGKNQSGMQAKEEISDTSDWIILNGSHTTPRQFCMDEWLRARDSAIEHVRHLADAGLHKQIANRILEPWFNIRVILSGTDFENFFALRAHPDAQPEFQDLASKMLAAYNASTPKKLKGGEWHIPFGDRMDMEKIFVLDEYDAAHAVFDLSLHDGGHEYQRILNEIKIKIAVARCARVSYFNFEGKDDYAKDIETCNKLFGAIPRHLSPAEHVAMATDFSDRIGNFRGWKLYRKFFEDENLKDSRVICTTDKSSDNH
jgi:thymidylate synthase ThyX